MAFFLITITFYLSLLVKFINSQACDIQSCKVCDQYLQLCSLCYQSLYLLNGYCVPNCPEGFLAIENICQECEQGCSKCLTLPTFCIQCSDNSQLIYQGHCVAFCQPTQYLNDNNWCIDCVSPCLTCYQSPSSCQSCRNDEYYLQNDQCIEQCNIGYYIQEQNISNFQKKFCKPCSSYCTQCQNDVICNQCKEGFYLFQDICIGQCPEGYKVNLIQGCSKISLVSLCPKGQVELKNEGCAPMCENNQYFQLETRKCKDCHQQCSQCNGPSENDCLFCHFSCQRCNGPNYYQCQSCQPTRNLKKIWNQQQGECACPLSADDSVNKQCLGKLNLNKYDINSISYQNQQEKII